MASVMSMIERRSGLDPAVGALREVLATCRETVDTLRSIIPEHRMESPTRVNINEVMRDVLDLTTTRMLAAGISRAMASAKRDAAGQCLSQSLAHDVQGPR